MPQSGRLGGLGILLLFFGLFSLSHVSASIVPFPGDFWEHSPRNKVSSDTQVELFIPPCMSVYSHLKELLAWVGRDKTFAAIGEVKDMKLAHVRGGEPCTIVYFRTLRPLTPNHPAVAKFYSPNAVYPVGGNRYRATGLSGYDCTRGLRAGDRILAVFHRERAEGWNLDPRLGEIWGPFTIWHLNGAPEDSAQCLYQFEGAGSPLKASPVTKRVPLQRRFVTDGRTLAEGVRALEAAYGASLTND